MAQPFDRALTAAVEPVATGISRNHAPGSVGRMDGGSAHNVVSIANRTPAPPDRQRLVVSEDEAAFMLGLAPRTLSGMRVDGSGPPFVKLSERRIGYAVSALKAWIEQRSVSSTSEATVAKTARRR